MAYHGHRRPPVLRDLRLRGGVALIGDVGRWFTFVGLTTVIGAVAFYYGTLGRAPIADKGPLAVRAARLGAWASLLILVGAALRLWDQYTALVDPTMTADESRAFFARMMMHTQWGRIWLASVLLAIAAWITLSRRVWGVALVVACLLALTPSLAGHAMGDKAHPIVTIAADAIHVAAASTWLGGLFVLALTTILRNNPPTSRGDVGGNAPLVVLVRAFSPVALISATTLGITGLWASYVHLGSWSAILGSAYGRTLCVKLLLVSGVAAVGAYNWRWATPRLVAGDQDALRTSARAELALGALVLLVTAILVASPLPMEMPM